MLTSIFLHNCLSSVPHPGTAKWWRGPCFVNFSLQRFWENPIQAITDLFGRFHEQKKDGNVHLCIGEKRASRPSELEVGACLDACGHQAVHGPLAVHTGCWKDAGTEYSNVKLQ